MKGMLRNIMSVVLMVTMTLPVMMAQKSQPLVREGVRWQYSTYWPTRPQGENVDNYYLFFKGSVELDGKLYNVCRRRNIVNTTTLDSACSVVAYLRQDGDKVFLRIENPEKYPGIYDSENMNLKECLIYDFSLDTGQSWKMMEEFPGDYSLKFAGLTNRKEIDSVKYISIHGVQTKVQYVNSVDWTALGTTPVVESIGCISDKIFPFPYLGIIPTGIGRPLTYFIALKDDNGNVLYEPAGVVGVKTDATELRLEGDALAVGAEGSWTLTLYRADGVVAMRHSGSGSQSVTIRGLRGVFTASLQTAATSRTLKIIR